MGGKILRYPGVASYVSTLVTVTKKNFSYIANEHNENVKYAKVFSQTMSAFIDLNCIQEDESGNTGSSRYHMKLPDQQFLKLV